MKRSSVAGALIVFLMAGGTAVAQESTDQVQIRNNVFGPSDIRVAKGQRVTWTLVEGRHSVTSDVAKRFDSGMMESAGQRFAFNAPRTDVTLYYHCRTHGIAGEGDRYGSGMIGRIVVGAGSPPPALVSDVDVRRVPSKRWPSLDASLERIEPDRRYRVDLAPGTYRTFDITPGRLGFKEAPDPRFELTISGAGRRPTDVVFAGASSLGLSVDGVRIENVSFRGQRFASVYVKESDRYSIKDVVVSKGARYGIWIEDAYHGSVRRTSITGAKVAGIAVNGCSECDLLVDSIMVERSLQGMSAMGTGSLVVQRSTFRNNGVGIALKGAARSGSHILLNEFRDNTNRAIEPPDPGPEKDLPVGAGVWIDGGSFDVVEHNEIHGHSFGVVLTGPNYDSRIQANRTSGSVEADVAWDGLGANVCFADNVSVRGSSASAMPPFTQELYGCALPATLGVPYPLVTATVATWGLDN